MKHGLLMMLTLILVLFLIACANTADQRMPEAIGETAQQAPETGAQNVLDADEAPAETQYDWPKDRLPASVPELKGIAITGIADIENGIEITFTGCDENETKMYTVGLTSAGWGFETENNELGKTVYATRENEGLIFFSPIYDDSNDVGTITYTRRE